MSEREAAKVMTADAKQVAHEKAQITLSADSRIHIQFLVGMQLL